MARPFYPFVDNSKDGSPSKSLIGSETENPQVDSTKDNVSAGQSATPAAALAQGTVLYAARIAVYDDAAAAPRVVIVDPTDVRSFLEEITQQVVKLSHEQGGTIPFMVIREVVENFIHAYFIEPTITILDGGNTIRFSDQGPGIKEKNRALEYGTSSATEAMKQFIRGVGSGLPYAQQYMVDKGGSLVIEDNISQGTVVTISTRPAAEKFVRPDTPQETATQLSSASQQPAYQPPETGQLAAQMQVPPVPPANNPYTQTYGGQGALQGYMPSYTPGYMPTAAMNGYPVQGYGQPYGTPGQVQYAPQGYVAPAQPLNQQQAMPSPQTQQLPRSNAQDEFAWISLTQRGHVILAYLKQHEVVGPSDLARVYGESQPTWTRELKTLEEEGLIKKEGQKRRLTHMGQAYCAKLA